MRYLYINQTENRISLISKKPEPEIITDNCVEYIVQDNFDLTKEMDDGFGDVKALEGFLTAEEFLARYNSDYQSQRAGAYPPVEDYLDAVVKNDTAAIEKYKADCLAVKAAFPKGETT